MYMDNKAKTEIMSIFNCVNNFCSEEKKGRTFENAKVE